MQNENRTLLDQYTVSMTEYKKQSQWKEVWRRLKKNRSAMAGLVVILIICLIAIFADLLANYEVDAITQNISIKLQAPSAEHWFGTDEFGRDIFARCIHGSRVSLMMGLLSTVLSFSIGLILGAVAGYYGGVVDSVIMRIMDMLLCIPSILLALVIVAALGTSIPNLLLAITIGNAPSFARMIRASIITVANQEYIDAARICGTRDRRIILHHIIPNTMGPIIVQATMSVAGCITATAGLSFVGMGIQAPRPEWGAMLSAGREFMRYHPHLVIIPGLFIVVTALSINLFGDGLRDAMDPRLKD
ncbi:MAG: ABC transporter permease [Oscillibacter sp.]|nr:ABC transporter permease [Oscillibacter sp.]